MAKYIDAEKLISEIERLGRNWDGVQELQPASLFQADLYELLDIIASLQQEKLEVDLDKLVNEEFASHSRTTEYGLEVTYNRAELYQLIKRITLVFNARKEDSHE